jgi:hypothetical protein
MYGPFEDSLDALLNPTFINHSSSNMDLVNPSTDQKTAMGKIFHTNTRVYRYGKAVVAMNDSTQAYMDIVDFEVSGTSGGYACLSIRAMKVGEFGIFLMLSGEGGSGGTNDYNDLVNKPMLNGVVLQGDKEIGAHSTAAIKIDVEWNDIINRPSFLTGTQDFVFGKFASQQLYGTGSIAWISYSTTGTVDDLDEKFQCVYVAADISSFKGIPIETNMPTKSRVTLQRRYVDTDETSLYSKLFIDTFVTDTSGTGINKRYFQNTGVTCGAVDQMSPSSGTIVYGWVILDATTAIFSSILKANAPLA